MKRFSKTKKKFKRSSQKQFDKFRIFFPFSCVDILIYKKNSILLTKRNILPYKGKWHFPGGLIRKNEKMIDAIKRITKEELNMDVKIDEFFGTYENLNRFRHDISHCFLGHIHNCEMTHDFQSSKIKFFKKPPSNMIPYHAKIMRDVQSYLNLQ